MGKEQDTRSEDDETEVDDTEEDETESDDSDNSSDSDKGWQRLEETIDKVVGKRLKEWRPEGNSSSGRSDQEKLKDRQSRKPARKKGFLSNFFEGL